MCIRDSSQSAPTASSTIGYEAELWQMADALRGSMDAAEYKHVVLGLLFLKYISDSFESRRDDLRVLAEPGLHLPVPRDDRALQRVGVVGRGAARVRAVAHTHAVSPRRSDPVACCARA